MLKGTFSHFKNEQLSKYRPQTSHSRFTTLLGFVLGGETVVLLARKLQSLGLRLKSKTDACRVDENALSLGVMLVDEMAVATAVILGNGEEWEPINDSLSLQVAPGFAAGIASKRTFSPVAIASRARGEPPSQVSTQARENPTRAVPRPRREVGWQAVFARGGAERAGRAA
jgi:hypothetical protein